MKLDLIGRGRRKKTFIPFMHFWTNSNFQKCLVYKKKISQQFSKKEIKKGLINFEKSKYDPVPNCLLGKHWKLIKLDLEELKE